MTRSPYRLGAAVFTAGLSAAFSPLARADYTLIDNQDFHVTASFKAGLFGVATYDTNFGGGTVNSVGEHHRDVDNSEYFLKPGLNFLWHTPAFGDVYGGVSGAATGQRGDGDPAGFTNGRRQGLNVDAAYTGWRKGGVDFSFGRQEFTVGDQFLIGNNANFNSQRDSTYWLAPFKAFENTLILKLDHKPWHADAFWLRSDKDQGNAELAGANLEYALPQEQGKLGVLAGQLISSSAPFYLPREGLEVYSVRANAIKLPFSKDLTLHGEAAFERGSGDAAGGTRYDAHAWYAEAEYQFSQVGWKPTVAYRHGYWSGDNDNDTDHVRESFDSLFFYSGRGWGTWYQGEITGEYLLFNSNQVTDTGRLVVHPSEAVTLSLMYFHTELAEPNFYGTPLTEKNFIDEFDFITEWTVDRHWSLAAVAAYGIPGAAAKQAFGNDQNYSLVEGAVWYTF